MADLRTFLPTRQRPKGGVETFSGKLGRSGATEPVAIDTEDYGSVLLRFVRLGPSQRCGLRFQEAELVKEKIVFAQRVGHLLHRAAQQRQQLLIRQEMPVAPDDGQTGTAALVVA